MPRAGRGGAPRPAGAAASPWKAPTTQVRTKFLLHHPNGDVALLDRAFKVGKNMHANQLRKSGEPYFFHPLAVAGAWRSGAWTP